MKLADIEPNPKQPRKNFDEQGLRELADNIKQVGLKQPLIVRPFTKGKYQLVDGERRYRASKLIDLKEVPVEIREDIKTEEDAAIQSYIMNEQRLNYSPQDKEAYIYHLYKTTGLSIRKLAAKLGVHHSHIDHLLEAYRFRQKLPPTLVGTLPLTSSMLKQTAGIKDDNLRIAFLKAIHDKRIKANGTELVYATSVLSKVPREAQEAYFRNLMTLEDIELYFIKNPKYMEEMHRKLEELDKKLKDGEITQEQYDKHPLANTPPTLIPMIKSSEILTAEEQEHFIMSPDLIKEERTGIVYIQAPEQDKVYKFTFDLEKERQTPEYKEWYERSLKSLEKHHRADGWGVKMVVNALAEWGKACEDGVIQATSDIEDWGLRIRTIQLVIDYRFAKWFQQAWAESEESEMIRDASPSSY